MVTTTVKLSPTLAAKLAAASRARRISKSDYIRESIEKNLKSNGKGRRPTFGEVSSHLAGSLKGGPRDLAANPKYMEGYGG